MLNGTMYIMKIYIYNVILNICQINEVNSENVSMCVNNFASKQNESILRYCNATTCKNVSADSKLQKINKGDNPWFGDICKQRYCEYKNAINNFNVSKTDNNFIV